jgi:hypothetical protein
MGSLIEWIIVFIVLFICMGIAVLGVSFLCNIGLVGQCSNLVGLL